MRWTSRIFRMVEAATRCPSRLSSPWILLPSAHRQGGQAWVVSLRHGEGRVSGRPAAAGLTLSRQRLHPIVVPYWYEHANRSTAAR
jgi:hypothetical protein